MKKIIKENFEESVKTSNASSSELLTSIQSATQKVIKIIDSGGKILSCGNGGSSGDAQHLSSELVNRFEKERKEIAGISLNSDTAIMTAIANDYDYKYIFAKQINALANSKDLLVAFTTSGNSENILEAIKSAKTKQVSILLITGNNGGNASKLLNDNDIEIRVPSNRTSRIQEIHLIIIHSICECIDHHIN
ncbi:MAG: phosphoheptose isomerase [Gammaproteobacteria bacterium]|nr:phosphoheptose isomerase [Gammaproteobacteria bacterium]